MRLYVPLNRQEFEALERLAYAERRRPQDQAAVLLAQTLADKPHSSVVDSIPSIEETPSHRSNEDSRVLT
jgi:hypothetical protein